MNIVEGRDIFVQDFIQQEKSIAASKTPSEIQRFFADSTILITGATGFLGKVLIEKLLRTCFELKKIYVIIRTKKGKNPEERFAELFDGPLYERLRHERPRFRNQIAAVSGDCVIPGFGLSEEDKQMLIREVDIVFHCAATVRFDEKLRVAVHINLNGTKSIMDLGREMKNLKSMVHVSTAYSNCPRNEVEEKFYKPPISYDNIMKLIDILDDDHLDVLTPSLIGKWPNTYTYTKMLAEAMVKDLGKGLPVAIIRPAIVTSTAYEPVCGWINNFFGPQGVTIGAAMGMLRTLHCDQEKIAELVPVDLVINATIALAWDIAQTKGDNPNFEKISMKDAEEVQTDSANVGARNEDDSDGSDIPIVNYVSSEKNPTTWGDFMEMNNYHGKNLGSTVAVWYCSITLNKNYYVDQVYQIILHFFPALVIDIIARIIGKKPILWNAYKKIAKFSKVISHFCCNEWRFHDDNVWKMWNKLTPRDKELFNFDIEALDWFEYFGTYMRGLRVYITKDDMSTVPAAKKRFRKLQVLHYITVTCVLAVLTFLFWKLFGWLFCS